MHGGVRGRRLITVSYSINSDTKPAEGAGASRPIRLLCMKKKTKEKKEHPGGAQGTILSREERLREIQEFNLLSDVFLSVTLRDIPACQHILRILTGRDDLTVKEVRTQYVIARIHSHDVRLDVLAEDGAGKLYLIEIQRRDNVDHLRRLRYYGSLADAEVNDGSRVAKLMEYFKTADPLDASEGELSKRVHYLKCEEGGVDIMCEISERIEKRGEEGGEKKGSEEKARTTAFNLFEMGMSPEQISRAVGKDISAVEGWLAGTE